MKLFFFKSDTAWVLGYSPMDFTVSGNHSLIVREDNLAVSIVPNVETPVSNKKTYTGVLINTIAKNAAGDTYADLAELAGVVKDFFLKAGGAAAPVTAPLDFLFIDSWMDEGAAEGTNTPTAGMTQIEIWADGTKRLNIYDGAEWIITYGQGSNPYQAVSQTTIFIHPTTSQSYIFNGTTFEVYEMETVVLYKNKNTGNSYILKDGKLTLLGDNGIPPFNQNGDWDGNIDTIKLYSFIVGNLTGAILMNATLDGANLSGVNFSGALLSGATLSSAILTNANLTNASLIGADLSSADLTDATLSSANLSGAFLDGATLFNVNLTGAILMNAILTNANLSGVNFSGALLTGALGLDADISVALAVINKDPNGGSTWTLLWTDSNTYECDPVTGIFTQV